MKNLFTAPGFALVTLMMIQPTALLAAAPDSPAPVTAGSQAPRKAVTLPAATVSRRYSHMIHAEGGMPPYTFSETSGHLKAIGLSIASDGWLTGIPKKSRLLEFTVAVHDSTDQVYAEQSYRLRVLPPQKRRQSQKSKKQIQGT